MLSTWITENIAVLGLCIVTIITITGFVVALIIVLCKRSKNCDEDNSICPKQIDIIIEDLHDKDADKKENELKELEEWNKKQLLNVFYHSDSDDSLSEEESTTKFHNIRIKDMEKNNIRFNVISAVDEQMCIGKDGVLPWSLPTEFQYFLSMTTKPRPGKQNAVIIGRKTWETMDLLTSKPFLNSLNIILTNQNLTEAKNYENTVVAKSVDAIIKILENEANIDEVWVLGGSETYFTLMKSPYFHRLYLTHIHAKYECDTYFPFMKQELEYGQSFRKLSPDEIQDPRVPTGIVTDSKEGVKFEVAVYEKRH
uniref:dihydrofolate reductase n=1 Tax=Clastoptera arizonana TaxID=38151 RepID=A0A1B6C1W0_9HEMI